MKRLNLCVVGVVALALAAAPVAFAQGTTSSATTTTTTTTDMNNQTVTGTVVSTSGNQVVITTDAGQRMTFDKGVSFTLPSNISVGDRVTVSYNMPSAGKYSIENLAMATTPSTTSGSTYNQSTTSSSTEKMSTTTTSRHARSARMPRTASPLPLAGLLGLLSLGAGAGLRVLNARRAR